MNWQKEFEDLVRSIGSITYGKERWFLQDNDLWYDRQDGSYIDINELHNRICEEVKRLDDKMWEIWNERYRCIRKGLGEME